MEKQYLKSEGKYLKAIDRMQQMQGDLELTQQELDEMHSLGGGVSLLPTSQEDIVNIKMLTVKHPDKVMQRLNLLMAEVNFIMDIFDFKNSNPKYANMVQQHVDQMIDIAEMHDLIQINSEDIIP